MSSYSFSSFLHWCSFLSDSIFLGLKFLVPLIFFLFIFKVSIRQFNLSCLTIAINSCLLIGGTLFLSTIIINMGKAWYSGNESERDFLISMITGPHWFQLVIPIFNYALLPNLMWFKNLRKSIFVSFALVICWYTSFFVMNYLTNKSEIHSIHASQNEFPIVEYAAKTVIFLSLLLIVYRILCRKHRK